VDQPQAALPRSAVTIDDLIGEAGGEEGLSPELLEERLKEDAHEAYDGREEELGAEAVRELERQVLLAVIDRKWREHLYEMDYLQEGVGLRAYAQRDPLVEYQREGFDMFQQMLDGIKEEAVGFLFNLEVQVEEPEVTLDEKPVEIHAKGLGGQRLPAQPAVLGAHDRRRGRVRRGRGRAAGRRASAGHRRRERRRSPRGCRHRRAPRRCAAESRRFRHRGDGESGAFRRNGVRQRQRAGRRRQRIERVGRVRRRRRAPLRPGVANGGRGPQAVAGAGDRERRPEPERPCYCGSGKKYKRCHGAPGVA
jgi:preprotein translocase subunit SecA